MSDRGLIPAPQTGLTLNFGSTDLEASDFVPPRIKVVQLMSVENTSGAAKPGDLVNTLTGEVYGPSLSFVPIKPSKQRILLVRDERRKEIEEQLGGMLAEGDGLLCRSFDTRRGVGSPGGDCTECPLAEWRGDKPPFCSEVYNIAASDEFGSLILLSFVKSSAKSGKRMFSAISMSAASPWAKVWTLTTVQRQNKQGTFWVLEPKMTGEAPSPELMKVILDRWIPALNAGQVVLDATESLGRDADDEDTLPAEGSAF